MKKSHLSVVIVLLILLLDQGSKLWVKTSMILGQKHQVASWFYINFQENPGMAFSMVLPGEYGKIVLSLFRVFAVGLLIYYIRSSIKEKAHWGFIAALSMILAGAIGNIIDGAFYGLVFSDSTYQVARLVSPGNGYTSFMKGHVVDMLWFPLWEGFLPAWIPVYGGQFFMFFGAVFNIADAAITGGVIVIAVFSWLFFKDKSPQPRLPAEPDHLSGRSLP
jgi:signal peptidase II